MITSKYLEQIIQESNLMRGKTSKRTLFSVILLAVISILVYIGLPMMDSRAYTTAVMLSGLLGFLTILFLIKYLQMSGKISAKTLEKCNQEIIKNINVNESIETFDMDIMNPAFGSYMINDSKVLVGKVFVLFQRITAKGPHFQVLRGDVLGEYKVHYFTQNGVGTDIGIDIKDRNGKFIRSVMTSDKEQFYKLLNALENIKKYAAGENTPLENFNSETDSFTQDVQKGIQKVDTKNHTRLGVIGVIFSVFLVIAGSSSGIGFIYGGFILFIASIIFIISVRVKYKRNN